MKRFLSAVALCSFLLLVGMFSLLPQGARAKENILVQLLNLPAPPPPNPLYRGSFRERDEKFYSKKNPPPDDAPIEDLLAYWKRQSELYQDLRFNVKPSERTLARLRAEIEKNPDTLTGFLNILPENAETAALVRRIYDGANKSEEWEKERIKDWLTMHSDQFSDDLVKTAERAGDTGEYVSNQDELLALARIDWEKARPIVERLYNSNQRVAPVLARWALYRRALDENSFGDIDRYRDELKSIVEDKTATAGMRDLAFDALVKETDWNGRDEWYFGLLEDETLADLRVNGSSYTGLTTLILNSDPDKYADKMIELLDSSNINVRNAAVRNLGRIVDKDHPQVVKALLPWLENPKWAKEMSGERRRLIDALQHLKITESVPGLVNVLDEKQIQEVLRYPNAGAMMANTAVNTMSTMTVANVASAAANTAASASNSYPAAASGGVRTEVEYYPFRSSAISALATQKDIRAVNALRHALPEVQEYERYGIIRAILVSGGFSIPEQLEAIELHAQGVKEKIKQEAEMKRLAAESVISTTSDGPVLIRPSSVGIGRGVGMESAVNAVRRPLTAAEITPILGAQIAANSEPDTEFLKALVERIGVLEKRDPNLAQALRRIMQSWNGTAVNALLLNDLKNDKLEIDAVVKLLSIRKELREKQINDVFNIRTGNATAFGLSACLLEDNNEYDAILAGNNAEAKTAMLGCARLIRAALPVRKVAENLQSTDKLLALAAERWLESEDSPEARQIVLARHPNEAKILGATFYFGDENTTSPDSDFINILFNSVNGAFGYQYYYIYSQEDLVAAEKKLQKEVKENQELLGVYAYDANFIRMFKDRAVFSWEEDAARYRERVLEADEFDNFKAFLASQKVDELAPFLGTCEECEGKELLMLGRGGGRRVFVRAEPLPEFFAELEKLFEDMRRPPAKLHYHLEKSIAGLEILFADDRLEAQTLWKNGADFRLLISNPARREELEEELTKLAQTEQVDETNYEQREKMFRQRRLQMTSQHLGWFKFADGSAVESAARPPQIELPPIYDGAAVEASAEQWKARTANTEVRADTEGLYKKSGGQFTKILSGYYDKPIVTANGRWAIATKYSDGRELVRVNLQTAKVFPIENEEKPMCEAKNHVAALNKILLVCGHYNDYYGREDEEEPEITGENYLLDAETGAIQKAKGELRPIAQQTFRALQSTAKADEFWSAIPDREKNETSFGIYNAKTLTFKETLKLPEIEVDSMNIWVDEGEKKIYIVYEGQMLSVPLK